MQTTTKHSTELLAYYRQISTEVFTIVDLETTGVKGDRDRIIEISVVQASLKDGIIQISTDLINPQILIPELIVKITGISQGMVDVAKEIDQVLPHYLPMLQTGILTAHNFKFDYSFLQSAYQRLGIDFTVSHHLCTVQLSRLLLANLQSRSLPKLVKHFGFNVGASHRAESDAIACWLLLEKLLTQILTMENTEILSLFGQQWLSAKDISIILQIPVHEVESLVMDKAIKSRFSRHQQINLYQRQGIEDLAAKMKLHN